MHNPPIVTYPIKSSSVERLILAFVWCAGFLACAFWLNKSSPLTVRSISLIGGLLVAGLAAIIGYRRATEGQLRWDGQFWYFQHADQSVDTWIHSLVVVLDLQFVVLLRLRGQARQSCWFWVEKATAPQYWFDFRRAIYAPASQHKGQHDRR